MAKIEYSSVHITQALREAIKGASELTEQTEEEFIHRILAFGVERAIRNNSETIIHESKNVEEEFESLKRGWELEQKGKFVLYAQRITSSYDPDVFLEAQEKFRQWKKNKPPLPPSSVRNSLKSLYKNIEHENKWEMIKGEKSVQMMKGKMTYDDFEKFVEDDGDKYRKEKGYIQSEIPIGMRGAVEASMGFPDLASLIPSLMGEIEYVSKMAQAVVEIVESDDDDTFTDEILPYIITVVSTLAIRNKIVKILGKKRYERFCKILKRRARKFFDHLMDKFE